MDGERVQVIERGVLTASDEGWAVAVRRAQMIGPLTAGHGWGLRPRTPTRLEEPRAPTPLRRRETVKRELTMTEHQDRRG
ncbi:hypothetical protein [Actinomadura opuntiae]|uniref:hypothetical protein n=1 Tax=Actinomadura sp. OS1-43 TaxID=604315 RepID=UPI00255AEB1B|nr:hypothetical protein [Actinomadura sp. OS1-43]MDL4813100.1 hypothetical protein [Actinomadura sp. OS1-43]